MSTINDTEFKKGAWAISMYPVMLALIFILEKIGTSGVCSPGLGFLFLLLIMPIATLAMLILNFVMFIKKGKLYRIAFLVHLLACIVLGSYFFGWVG